MSSPVYDHNPQDGKYGPCPHCVHSGRIRGAAPMWHARKGPGPILRKLHGLPDYETAYLSLAWIDHPYRMRLPNGRWCYVSEPYSLTPDAFGDLSYLEDHGYVVNITSYQARHYHGHTLAIWITEDTA